MKIQRPRPPRCGSIRKRQPRWSPISDDSAFLQKSDFRFPKTVGASRPASTSRDLRLRLRVSASILLLPKETIIRSRLKTPTQDVPDFNYDSRLRRKGLIALTLKKIVAKSPTKCDGFELFSDSSIISPTSRIPTPRSRLFAFSLNRRCTNSN